VALAAFVDVEDVFDIGFGYIRLADQRQSNG
jgi:hypothetical protein